MTKSPMSMLAAALLVGSFLTGGETSRLQAGQDRLLPGAVMEGALEDGDHVLPQDGSFYDEYRLDVEAGNTYTITMRSDDFDTYLILASRQGGRVRFLAQNDDAPGMGLNSRIVYAAEEDARLIVFANSFAGGETGDYTLEIEEVASEPAGPPDEAAGALQPDEPVAGELQAPDPQLRDGSYYDAYLLEVRAGSRYTITLRSDEFDPFLLLWDENRRELARNDDAEGLSLDAQIVYEADEDRELLVLANSFRGGETGRYTLEVKVEEAPAEIGPDDVRRIVPGRAVEGELTEDDPQLGDDSHIDLYVLEVRAGRTYTITMTSADFDAFLLLGDEQGNELARNDDAEGLAFNAQIVHRAEEDALWIVGANSYGPDETGEYRLEVEVDRADDVQPASRLRAGRAVEGSLEEGDRTLEQDGSFYDTYRLDVGAGNTYTITMRSDEFDTYLILADARGRSLVQNDDAPGLGLNSRIVYEAVEDARLTVLANSFKGGETGAYRLELEVTPTTEQPAEGDGRYFAVLAGIYDYIQASDLPGCDDDARRMARALGRVVPRENLHLLTNGDVTLANFRAALEDVAERAGPEDTVIIFFSGHGSQGPVDESLEDEPDRRQESLYLQDGHLYDDELAETLDRFRSRLTIVALDSCFSGGFNRDCISAPGRMGLFSSDEDLTSGVPTDAGGYLSKFLILALEGDADGAADDVQGPADGLITALELEKYIRDSWQTVNVRVGSIDDIAGFQYPVIYRSVPPDTVVVPH